MSIDQRVGPEPLSADEATYHGSLTELHGPCVVLGDCVCPDCDTEMVPRAWAGDAMSTTRPPLGAMPPVPAPGPATFPPRTPTGPGLPTAARALRRSPS